MINEFVSPIHRRTVLLALGGGVLKAITLLLPLYLLSPAAYSSTWIISEFPEIVRKVAYFPDMLLSVAIGYAAARVTWSPSKRWHFLTALTTGALAGIVAWLLIGAGTAGVAGSAPLLQNALQPVANEQIAFALLSDTNIGIMWWLHLSFWLMLGQGVALGLVGGMLFVWHQPSFWGPAPPDSLKPTIWKAMAVTLLFISTTQLFTIINPYYQWVLDTTKMAATYNLTLRYSPTDIFSFPLSAALLMMLIAVWWNWLWIAPWWRHPNDVSRRNAWIAAGFTLFLPLLVFGDVDQTIWTAPEGTVLWLGAMGLLLITAIGVLKTWRYPPPVFLPEPDDSPPPEQDQADDENAQPVDPTVPPRPLAHEWMDHVLVSWILGIATIVLTTQGLNTTMSIWKGETDYALSSVDATIDTIFWLNFVMNVGAILIPLIFALVFALYSWVSHLVIVQRV